MRDWIWWFTISSTMLAGQRSDDLNICLFGILCDLSSDQVYQSPPTRLTPIVVRTQYRTTLSFRYPISYQVFATQDNTVCLSASQNEQQQQYGMVFRRISDTGRHKIAGTSLFYLRQGRGIRNTHLCVTIFICSVVMSRTVQIVIITTD